MVSEALNALGVKDSTTHKDEKVQVAINTLPWPRSEVVVLNAGEGLGTQDAGTKQYAIASTNAYGTTVLDPIDIQLQIVGKGATITKKDDGIFILGNGKLQVTIQGGQILSLLDVELNREVIAKGERANRLILYDDQPLYWDAWDVELYHLETPEELGMGNTKITEEGPLRVALLVEHKISERSWIKTTISLDAYIPSTQNYGEGFKDPLSYLQFECEVEWHENRRFLKAEFPVDIYCDTVFPLPSSPYFTFVANRRPRMNVNLELSRDRRIIIRHGTMRNSRLSVTNGRIFRNSAMAYPSSTIRNMDLQHWEMS